MSPRSRLSTALLAEGLGSAGLLMVIIGSGIMAERLAAGNAALALLANAFATGCGLYVLITIFASASGAHFNPLVSILAWLDGTLQSPQLLAYALAQFAGAIAGTLLAHGMFDLDLLQLGIQSRRGIGQFLSELVATAGLVMTLRALAKRDTAVVATAVAAYISAAYWFTASTAFANPAVTFARSLTTTFAGIEPADVPAFIAAQCMGALIGGLLSRRLAATQG